MASDSPVADVSVRPARPGDEIAIATIQVAAWIAALGDRLGPRRKTAFDQDAIQASWAASIAQPPTPQHRVLVALGGEEVQGFAAVAPPHDIVALEVSPDKRRRGHGSRLLSAAADHLRQQGATQMRLWSLEKDAVRTDFLREAGFELSGMRRELDGPGITIPEQLWATSLETDDASA